MESKEGKKEERQFCQKKLPYFSEHGIIRYLKNEREWGRGDKGV
jgi:hypothetical protein